MRWPILKFSLLVVAFSVFYPTTVSCKVGQEARVSQTSREGNEILGTVAPEWTVTHWLNSTPLTLQSLRGKVVLVRWWTAPGCPYCAASAPALNEFHEFYREKGLVVIGFYHHKSPQPLNPEEVPRLAKQFGFEFPVAIDPEWRTLRRWWLRGRESVWTSVSFLIDREGVIRYIHPGGAYVKGDSDYLALKQKIEELITTQVDSVRGG